MWLYIDVMVIDHQMPNTVKQAYNDVPEMGDFALL